MLRSCQPVARRAGFQAPLHLQIGELHRRAWKLLCHEPTGWTVRVQATLSLMCQATGMTNDGRIWHKQLHILLILGS